MAFSVLLIMIIQGLYQGWSIKIGEYIRTIPTDFWVTQAGATDMFHTPSVLQLNLQKSLETISGAIIATIAITVYFRAQRTNEVTQLLSKN